MCAPSRRASSSASAATSVSGMPAARAVLSTRWAVAVACFKFHAARRRPRGHGAECAPPRMSDSTKSRQLAESSSRSVVMALPVRISSLSAASATVSSSAALSMGPMAHNSARVNTAACCCASQKARAASSSNSRARARHELRGQRVDARFAVREARQVAVVAARHGLANLAPERGAGRRSCPAARLPRREFRCRPRLPQPGGRGARAGCGPGV